MQRDEFLARVKSAAVTGRRYRVAIRDVPPDTGYVGAGPDLCQALADEITLVGGIAYLVDDMSAARVQLEKILLEAGAKRVLCWQHPVLDKLGLRGLLANHDMESLDYDSLLRVPVPQRRQKMLLAEVGVSSVSLAIAELGSLAVFTRTGQERLTTLLAPVHVAVIEQSQIVPDLFDVFHELSKMQFDELPSAVAFITGPSKTGDIELQLTTGVHGPGTWIAIIVRGGPQHPLPNA